jgi:glyoxylase-like metal-dependent hydrolase (beta-lactamase superfamily II)
MPVPSVTCIRIENAIVRAVVRFGGGYNYSVSYLVDGELLIDTGFPWARRSLRETLLRLGADRSIRCVVNTHYHEDHTGNNDLVTELTRAPIFAHADALAQIRHPIRAAWYRAFLFGPIEPTDVQPIPAELTLAHYRFTVVPTPGHCPGHICLFEPSERWLFSGDLYIAPDLDSQLSDANGPLWITSLQKAIGLDAKCLFDAHGVVVTSPAAVRELLTRKLAFLLALRDRISDEARTPRPIREITRAVFGGSSVVNALSQNEGWLSLITASDFSRGNLVRSFLEASQKTA